MKLHVHTITLKNCKSCNTVSITTQSRMSNFEDKWNRTTIITILTEWCRIQITWYLATQLPIVQILNMTFGTFPFGIIGNISKTLTAQSRHYLLQDKSHKEFDQWLTDQFSRFDLAIFGPLFIWWCHNFETAVV